MAESSYLIVVLMILIVTLIAHYILVRRTFKHNVLKVNMCKGCKVPELAEKVKQHEKEFFEIFSHTKKSIEEIKKPLERIQDILTHRAKTKLKKHKAPKIKKPGRKK